MPCHNKSLADVLDKHAPMRKKVTNARPPVPWFNEEIKLATREKEKQSEKGDALAAERTCWTIRQKRTI